MERTVDCVEFLEATQERVCGEHKSRRKPRVERQRGWDNGYKTITEIMHDGGVTEEFYPTVDYWF